MNLPFGKLELERILLRVPPFVFALPYRLSESDMMALQSLFCKFYSKLDKLELVELNGSIVYDEVAPPVLGIICFIKKPKDKVLKVTYAKTYVMPFSNLGELHWSLTLRNPEFVGEIKKGYPKHVWRQTTKLASAFKVFANAYRKELYSRQLERCSELQKRVWARAMRKAQKFSKHWDIKVIMWGLRVKGAKNILPDYRVFI